MLVSLSPKQLCSSAALHLLTSALERRPASGPTRWWNRTGGGWLVRDSQKPDAGWGAWLKRPQRRPNRTGLPMRAEERAAHFGRALADWVLAGHFRASHGPPEVPMSRNATQRNTTPICTSLLEIPQRRYHTAPFTIHHSPSPPHSLPTPSRRVSLVLTSSPATTSNSTRMTWIPTQTTSADNRAQSTRHRAPASRQNTIVLC